MRRLFSKLGPVLFLALLFAPIVGLGAFSAYHQGWHPLFIVLFALGLPIIIVIRVLLGSIWEQWSPKWFANVTEKEDTARMMAAEDQDRRVRRIGEGRRALYRLRKEDPEAAARIAAAVDSGKVSSEDVAALIARARQDGLSAEELEARIRADGRLLPPERPPTEEAGAAQPRVLVCAKCSRPNPSGQTSCWHCGMPLAPP